MTDPRKYREEEVSEIFALAASAGDGSLPIPTDPEGLTLDQLQEVGREVGLAPERVAAAAASLDARASLLPRRTLLGAPVSVGRVVPLPRSPTDREWQFLVAELRETFGAKGRVSTHGHTREWTNGHLHAVLEETETGPRLRLGTYKGNAREMVAGGVSALGMAVLMLVAMLSKGKTGMDLLFPALFVVAGGGALASNFLRLPRWADQRERQMEHIAARALGLVKGGPAEPHALEPAPER